MNLYFKSFIYGFMYIFGMVKSPIPKDIEKLYKRKDDKAISEDWMLIGKDMMKAYEAAEKPTA